MEQLVGWRLGTWGLDLAVRMHAWLWSSYGDIYNWELGKVSWFLSVPESGQIFMVVLVLAIGVVLATYQERDQPSANWWSMIWRGFTTMLFWFPGFVFAINLAIALTLASLVYGFALVVVCLSGGTAFLIILFEWPLTQVGVLNR